MRQGRHATGATGESGGGGGGRGGGGNGGGFNKQGWKWQSVKAGAVEAAGAEAASAVKIIVDLSLKADGVSPRRKAQHRMQTETLEKRHKHLDHRARSAPEQRK